MAEIPAQHAENAGWQQAAMPGMLTALGLTEPPSVAWFVAGTNPLYDEAVPDGWRYCHSPESPNRPDLFGITYAGPPPRVYLRANLTLPQTIRVLGHELYHVWECANGIVDSEARSARLPCRGSRWTSRTRAAGWRRPSAG